MVARLHVARWHLRQRGEAAGDAHQLRRDGGADGCAQVGRDAVHPRLQSALAFVRTLYIDSETGSRIHTQNPG